jgi:multimeric flavodoxin WrbA
MIEQIMYKKLQITAIFSSPRKNSFSSNMANAFLTGFQASSEIKLYINKIYVAKSNISVCVDCGVCKNEYKCTIQDDMHNILKSIIDSDLVLIATPIYFSGVPAQLKMLIDRTQMLWMKKQRGEITISPKIGVLYCAAGSNYKSAFTGTFITLKHFFNTVNASFDENRSLLFENTDNFTDIPTHITESAMKAGKKYFKELTKKL